MEPGRRQLDDDLYDRLVARTEHGNRLADEGRHEDALAEFRAALDLLPHPIEEWEASTWVLAAIADSLFFLGRYTEVRETLAHAMRCPDALGNPFIHLRLGQAQFELGNTDRAKDELARAYMGGGPEIFSEEDPKYLAFVRRYMRGI